MTLRRLLNSNWFLITALVIVAAFVSARLDFWIYLNVDRIGQPLAYPTLPAYVQLNPISGSTTPPIAAEVELDLGEGSHVGYAIQWLTFALIMLLAYPFWVRRQEEKPR